MESYGVEEGDQSLHSFVEIAEVTSLISALPTTVGDTVASEAGLERFMTILNRYQEKPQLLDCFLEDAVVKLLVFARSSIASSQLCCQAFKFLTHITKVRGHKYIVRLLPHEAADLEPVLELLSKQDAADHTSWEVRYMLLIWLSMLTLTPLDMSRLDGSVKDASNGQTVSERILAAAKRYVCVTDKCRDAAALLLAKFVSRPDIKVLYLPSVMEWLFSRAQGVDTSTLDGMSIAMGTSLALTSIFKHCHREDVCPFAVPALQWMKGLFLNRSGNTLQRKLAIKLTQRLGLALLPARLCTWRYQRGNRSLAQGLAGERLPQKETISSSNQNTEEEEENIDIPDELEDVLEKLLTGLCDGDTIVRWSAAKGIGRVTARLPHVMGDEVVGFVLQHFSQRVGDGAWHGGCLALAELGRRGLLLPARLRDVVPVVVRALNYDEQRGSYSVGGHVRDAACYLCWAFARAYEPAEFRQYVEQVASALVVTMVFDREVNCRRAASAAFQENVGRQGAFPHGIEIVTTADYFAVGNRNNSYLNISASIAQYSEYCRPLIEHLVSSKLRHWDDSIRVLAASALHKLTACDPDYVASTVLPELLHRTLSVSLATRHGGLLGVGEVCHALHKLCPHSSGKKSLTEWIGQEAVQCIERTVDDLTKQDMFRGVDGSFTRFATCHMIRALSQAQLPACDSTVLSWQAVLEDCMPHIDHTDAWIQDCAVEALAPLFSQYYCLDNGLPKAKWQASVVDKFCQELRSSLVYAREGYARGLAALPRVMLRGKARQVISCLVAAATIEKGTESKFAEGRCQALKAMMQVCKTAGFSANGDDPISLPARGTISTLYETFLTALGDYSTDGRGDVGAWVREAALVALEELTLETASLFPDLLDESLVKHVMGAVLQQASEKIDRIRVVAGRVFARLLYSKTPKVPNIPHQADLAQVFPEKEVLVLNWSTAVDVYHYLVQVLSLPAYRERVLLGLVVSVGGLTESLVRHSSTSLLEYLRKESVHQLTAFAAALLRVFKDHQKKDRVTMALLKTADLLLSNGCFGTVEQCEDGTSFPVHFLDVCKAEVSRCADAKKLIISVPVFCGMLQFSSVQQSCLQQLAILLGHKYPRVRRTTADQLYVAVVTYDDIVDPENLDEVMLILSETEWDADLTTVRQVRNNLCQLLGVPSPKALGKPTKQATVKEDTFSSYQDLVDRAGY